MSAVAVRPGQRIVFDYPWKLGRGMAVVLATGVDSDGRWYRIRDIESGGRRTIRDRAVGASLSESRCLEVDI